MDICRAFDIFEIVVLVLLIFILVYLIRIWYTEVFKTKGWISGIVIGVPLGLVIGGLLVFSYTYIKSMFC